MSVDVVERVRMAVAEAGYDPALVIGERRADGSWFIADGLPLEVAWRAREIASRDPICWRCTEHANDRWIEHAVWLGAADCLADRRFVEDCGVERPS